jgi:hypothetical protein
MIRAISSVSRRLTQRLEHRPRGKRNHGKDEDDEHPPASHLTASMMYVCHRLLP